MSETLPEVEQPPVRQAALARRASPADIETAGEWLLPRLAAHYMVSGRVVLGWLLGTMGSNSQMVVACGDAMGAGHVEPGHLGRPPRVAVDFVLAKNPEEQTSEMQAIFRTIGLWAKGMGAEKMTGVDDLTDCDRLDIRVVGKLTKRDVYEMVFLK